MALYYYYAFSKDGKRQIGQLDAPSEQGVKDALVKRGLFPAEIGLVKGANTGLPWYKRWFEGNVSIKEKIMFTKQLAVLLRSGIPLMHALELLVEQFQGKMRTIIVQLKDGVKEGRSLTDGLKEFPNDFSKIYVQLVRAGEATGNLDMILNRLNIYLERDEAIRKKVKGAMRYPMIQMSIVALVVVVLLTFVVPKLAKTFANSSLLRVAQKIDSKRSIFSPWLGPSYFVVIRESMCSLIRINLCDHSDGSNGQILICCMVWAVLKPMHAVCPEN